MYHPLDRRIFLKAGAVLGAGFGLSSLGGGAGWILFITMAGFSLGQVTFIRQNFEKVVLLIIFLSLLPVIIEVMKARRRVVNT